MKSFIILLMFSFLDSADSSCPKGGYNNSQPQFGPGCMYRCHCMDDVQCDYTGYCIKGCAAGWMGPGCQYGDIAYNKQVQQLLYGSNLFIDGRNATDGLPTTCAGPATLVVIDLNATYRISGLVITSSDAVNLTAYEVRVGNYSSNRLSSIVDKCFKETITHQLDTSTDVVCTTEIVGRYLLIRTPDNATTMTLCDVRVYGGRSLAYRHNGSQSTTIGNDVASRALASRALDGNTDTSFWSSSCTHTNTEMSPWWRVNLAVVYNIARIVLYGRSDCCTERLSGFSVSVATNSSSSLVFKHPKTTPPLMTEVITLSENNAQHVEISLKDITEYLTLCEVFVFGDCQDNMCGWTCDIYCYCEGPIAKQNIVDAHCTSGCKTGWWGYSCNNTCDSNCKGNTCNQRDGYCLECSQGKWGHFCNNNCTNCLQGTGCGASEGICGEGCLTGLFGVRCGEHCGQCAADGSCNRYTGDCIHGCQPGWQEENCTNACPLGWYGINCSNICGHCANTTCDHINGTCPFGCTEGYNGTRCYELKPRQHSIAFLVCGFWQHRTCRTGISLLAYREAVNNRGKIGFTCRPCRELNQVPVSIDVTDQDKDDSVDPPFLELSVPVTLDVTDQDKDDSVDPPFLELSIPSIGDLSNDIPVAESTEIEMHPYGASTIVHIHNIPDMDCSFDISDTIIDPVHLIEEESVHDVLTETMVEYRGITYTILEGASQKHTRLLVSNLGYSYGIKRDNVNSTLWRCTSRSLNVKCPVTIRQQDTHPFCP